MLKGYKLKNIEQRRERKGSDQHIIDNISMKNGNGFMVTDKSVCGNIVKLFRWKETRLSCGSPKISWTCQDQLLKRVGLNYSAEKWQKN